MPKRKSNEIEVVVPSFNIDEANEINDDNIQNQPKRRRSQRILESISESSVREDGSSRTCKDGSSRTAPKWGLYIDNVIQSEWWVSPSSLFNFMLKDPLLDWLKGRPVMDNPRVFEDPCINDTGIVYNPDEIENADSPQAERGVVLGHAPPLNLVGCGATAPLDHSEFDKESNFRDYILNKGVEFEAKVVAYLFARFGNNIRQVSHDKDDIKKYSKFVETVNLMKQGCPIIVQAVLHDKDMAVFGCADLIVRSDWIDEFIKDFDTSSLARQKTIKHPAPGLNKASYHYRIIDIKFKTLSLTADGIGLLNTGTIPACKAQVILYNKMLGKIQKYEPDECYLLGRGFKYTSKDETYIGNNCFDKLGTVFPHDRDIGYLPRIKAGIKWKRELKMDGEKWQILPIPSRPELYPNMNNAYDFPYHGIKKELADSISDITQLWYCGVKNREIAFTNGIRNWRDKKCTAKLIGVNGPTIGRILQKMLDFNHGILGNHLMIPQKIKNNWDNWRSKHQRLEFYIDFENFNSIIDDFSSFPVKDNMGEFIFMAGIGYRDKNNEWVYKCFYAKEITLNAEHDMFDELHRYVASVCREWKDNDPIFYHWGNAEKHLYEKMIERHESFLRNKRWRPPRFCDFLNIMKDEPILIKGVMSFGLKDVGNGMNRLGLIDLSWPADINGQDAMIQCLDLYRSSAVSKDTADRDTTDAAVSGDTADRNMADIGQNPKYKDIIDYNEIDCKMICEIINRLRM